MVPTGSPLSGSPKMTTVFVSSACKCREVCVKITRVDLGCQRRAQHFRRIVDELTSLTIAHVLATMKRLPVKCG